MSDVCCHFQLVLDPNVWRKKMLDRIVLPQLLSHLEQSLSCFSVGLPTSPYCFVFSMTCWPLSVLIRTLFWPILIYELLWYYKSWYLVEASQKCVWNSENITSVLCIVAPSILWIVDDGKRANCLSWGLWFGSYPITLWYTPRFCSFLYCTHSLYMK